MKVEPRKKLRLLLALKEEFGDLNTALVAAYIQVYGWNDSNLKISNSIGLSRATVRRAKGLMKG